MELHVPNVELIRYYSRIMLAADTMLRENGFVRVTVPRIVPASGACENIDTLFEISSSGDMHWFSEGRQRAYFAQTGQLYLESLLGREGLNKVYCVGPSGRAEPKADARHLTEFEMIEIEFAGNFKELLEQIESFIYRLAYITTKANYVDWDKIKPGYRPDHLEKCPKVFPKIQYADAIKHLGLEWGSDISSAQEQQLISEHGGVPVLIVRYPNPESARMQHLFRTKPDNLAIKFFNMTPDPADPEYVLSADCIVPFGGECVGSAERVWQYEQFRNRLMSSLMMKQLKQKDKNAENGFAWYLGTLKEFGSVQHAGCGFGMSRIMQYLLGVHDIRQVVAFPSNKEFIC